MDHRLCCTGCGKTVSTEVPEGTIVRAVLTCPECLEREQAELPGLAWSEIAASAYAAYGHSTGNKNFRGDPMPRWDQLPVPIRTAWEAAVRHASDVSVNPASDPEMWAGWVSPNYKQEQ